MDSHVQRENLQGCVVLRFQGKFDLESHGALKALFAELLVEDEPRVVLNLREVRGISSSVVGALVGFMRELQAAGGRLALAELSRNAALTLNLLRLEEFFPVYSSETEAASALASAQ